jgi:hypothetical protein
MPERSGILDGEEDVDKRGDKDLSMDFFIESGTLASVRSRQASTRRSRPCRRITNETSRPET